jgi:hypothetical protein
MIYIAGQIAGLPLDEAKDTFRKAEDEFRSLGLDVTNPLKMGIPETWSWEDQIAECKRVIRTGIDAIYFLRGWQKSKGAVEEWKLVNELNSSPSRNIIIYLADEGGMRQVVNDINDGVLTCLISEL